MTKRKQTGVKLTTQNKEMDKKAEAMHTKRRADKQMTLTCHISWLLSDVIIQW